MTVNLYSEYKQMHRTTKCESEEPKPLRKSTHQCVEGQNREHLLIPINRLNTEIFSGRPKTYWVTLLLSVTYHARLLLG